MKIWQQSPATGRSETSLQAEQGWSQVRLEHVAGVSKALDLHNLHFDIITSQATILVQHIDIYIYVYFNVMCTCK